jgi:hypothetical protein
MLSLFGAEGKKSLDRIVMNETFKNAPIDSPKDIRNLYEMYMERVSNLLGDSTAKVIEFQSSKQMRSAFCKDCPLFKKEIRK